MLRDPHAQAAAVAGRTVVEGWPPDPDEQLHDIVAALDRLSALKVFTAEFDHYGSGYASFVEVRLTRRDDSLVTLRDDVGLETLGFGVLLCRLAPIATLQASFFDWRSGERGASSMVDREDMTDLPVAGFPESPLVADALRTHGYELVEVDALREPIATGVAPETNLGTPPWTVFDAWFHWYD